VTTPLRQSSFRFVDSLRVGTAGLGARKFRTALSALGITIGIAAMVGVLGLSESSRADLQAEIEALGTNLLTVEPGTGFGSGDATLPEESTIMVRRIGAVEAASGIIDLEDAVLLNDQINPTETGGVEAMAVDLDLLTTLNGSVVTGTWFDEATAAYPTVVLGAVSAERLGIDDVSSGQQILIGDVWFTAIGILAEFPLAANLDRAAMIGYQAATTWLDADLNPGTIQVRTRPEFIDAVRGVLPATADPQSPEEVEVSRPSDALEAQAAADSAFTSLFLGLGAVALLVGSIGIANVMVIAVIERRDEIGLRRALGATRAHIRRQFLFEALLLSVLGGATGVALGSAVTVVYARTQDWQVVLPPEALIGGFVAAVVIGAVAGLYPAMRAARLSPTEALRS
jgi:putative ABC transport system permease protein